MGKYDKYDGMAENEAVPTLLCVIANEIAEANRLKRLELRQIDHKIWNEATSQKLTEKDLEDQA